VEVVERSVMRASTFTALNVGRPCVGVIDTEHPYPRSLMLVLRLASSSADKVLPSRSLILTAVRDLSGSVVLNAMSAFYTKESDDST